MTAASGHGVVVTSPGVAWVGIDAEVVARDAAGGVHLLDPRAALVWAHVDGQHSAADIVDAVIACVPGAVAERRDVIAADVVGLLDSLSALGLVQRRDDGRVGQVSAET